MQKKARYEKKIKLFICKAETRLLNYQKIQIKK